MIRLGRISYVNMAPVFHRLNAEVEEVQGVPTELNRLLLDGRLDLAPISSIEYARHASSLRILPRMCVSSEGAVDSIQLVSRAPLARIASVAVTPESRIPLISVIDSQWPGVFVKTRCPTGARPYVRVIAVLAPHSSTKTSRRGSTPASPSQNSRRCS